MDEDTFLVSVMWVNNELGTIQDIPALAEIAHAGGAWFHVDAVQAMTTQAVSVKDVDLLSLSSHKIYGPKGAGVLYARAEVPLAPLLHGGQQERHLRGGTENVPAIIGMGAAAQLLQAEQEQLAGELARWKSMLLTALGDIDGVQINSPPGITADNVLHLSIRGAEAEGILFHLARAGVQASMGSACNTEAMEPSHVVRAVGIPEEYARGCIRLSIGRGLDDTAVRELADRVRGICIRQTE